MILKVFSVVVFLALVFGPSVSEAIIYGYDDTPDNYDTNIVLNVATAAGSTFVWKKGDKLSALCPNNGSIAWVVHGFQDPKSNWGDRLVKQYLKYRGGCAIYMDWGYYALNLNYYGITLGTFKGVADSFLRRLLDLEADGFIPDNWILYGHSLGGRLVISAGVNFGAGRIANVEVCDQAGPGFIISDVVVQDIDARNAGKNVQCIHTSASFGTVKTDTCHQDWLMGYCGIAQAAACPISFGVCEAMNRSVGMCASEPTMALSHNLCNEFYISAFDNDFVANNYYGCPGCTKLLTTLPKGFKMGYKETRKSSSIIGRIAAPTSLSPPFTGAPSLIPVANCKLSTSLVYDIIAYLTKLYSGLVDIPSW